MMYDWGAGNNGYGAWDFIFMLLMMAVIVVGLVMAVRNLGGNGPVRHEDEALSILKKRYANGEIDQKEFEQKRKDLS